MVERADRPGSGAESPASDRQPVVEAVAGVLQRPDGEILVCERPDGKRLAGYLEFPGGKIEAGESPLAALTRELSEEIGITVIRAEPLIRFEHGYSDYRVRLRVFRVAEWVGEPEGLEAQGLVWVAPVRLDAIPLLPANKPVVAALSLPSRILVTPPFADAPAAFLERLERALAAQVVDAVILRSGSGTVPHELAVRVSELGARFDVPVLLNAMGNKDAPRGFAGLHLPASLLRSLTRRPDVGGWLGASVHNTAEAMHARHLGLDYVLIGNVRGTSSHPDRSPLGWTGFERIAAAAGVPAYAIGGVGPSDLEEVRQRWGQGVAAIRAFWSDAALRDPERSSANTSVASK